MTSVGLSIKVLPEGERSPVFRKKRKARSVTACGKGHSVAKAESSSSFHPPEFDEPMISESPENFQSHFIRLTTANRKGQARYRCVMCNHEFECTGKMRLVQHIIGSTYSERQAKDVRSCPKPFLPLKLAMRTRYHPKVKGSNVHDCEDYTTDLSESTAFKEFDDSSNSNSFDDDDDLCDLFGFDPNETPLAIAGGLVAKKQKNVDLLTHRSASKKPRSDGKVTVNSMDNFDVIVANEALLHFFSSFQLPTSAIEHPAFCAMVQAIQIAGPNYRPSREDLSSNKQTTVVQKHRRIQTLTTDDILSSLPNDSKFNEVTISTTVMQEMMQEIATTVSSHTDTISG